MLTAAHHNRLAAPCHACGEPTFARALRHADDLRSDVIALLGISERTGHACTGCVDRAEREIDGAADALELDEDPAFATVCDERHEGYLSRVLESETAAQWAAAVRCGGDAMDRAVSL